ncbi:MAG TPA: response regulator transcription factor [Bacteroidia bacterium]|nr:response regulator transcription factor [Bacteroidia bacterium]
MKKSKIRVAITDDHPLFREGMSALLNEEPEIKVILKASNGRELLDQLKTTQVDVLLLDLEMPVMPGRETLDIVKMRYPDIKVLILTMHNDDSFIVEMVDRGANGFLLKDNSVDDVIDGIICVTHTDYYFTKRVRDAIKNINELREKHQQSKFEKLTPREIEIVKMICRDMKSSEIAQELNISLRTVEGHRNNLIAKTNCKTTAGVVLYAIKNKIL